MADRTLRIGPEIRDHSQEPKGSCDECGGQCDGNECGLHAAGCVYGGFGYGYWLIAEGCPLWHGDIEDALTKEGK